MSHGAGRQGRALLGLVGEGPGLGGLLALGWPEASLRHWADGGATAGGMPLNPSTGLTRRFLISRLGLAWVGCWSDRPGQHKVAHGAGR